MIAGTHAEQPAPWLGDIVRDIEVLAEWNHMTGQVDRGVLAPLALGAPTDVIAVRDRLLALSAAEVLSSPPPSVADLLEQALLGMNERFRTICARRLFAWEPVTLEDLGQEFGVTRERARQLQSGARAELNELIAEGTPVGRVAALIRSEIRGIRPLPDLLAEVPALERLVECVGHPAWRVIDVLDETYEIADGWCAEPSLDAAKRQTAIMLDELADEFGVVRLEDIDFRTSEEPGTAPWLASWLTHLGYQVRGGFVLVRTASVNDLAAALLSIEGGPLTIEALFEGVNRGSFVSFRNRVNADPRFHKVDIENWALAAWGMDSYTNIRDEIGKLLQQAGGELLLANVVDLIVERFGVSPGSVTTYAAAAPYEVRNGVVRARALEIVGGKNPAKVHGYYRRGEDWLYRTTVTNDHMRGSGWAASSALATIVGMSRGESAELPTRLGTSQKFSWKGPQAAYGSIKRFLETDDLGIGDEIFLVFRGDGTFDIEKLPDVPKARLAQALRLVGAEMSLKGQEATAALGAAIRYASGSDLTSVVAGYEARREQQIRDLLISGESE